jgi:hypothetical protein
MRAPPAVAPGVRSVETAGHESRRTRSRCARRWEEEDRDPAIFLALRRFADVELDSAASSKTTGISRGLAIDAGGADGGGGGRRNSEKSGRARDGKRAHGNSARDCQKEGFADLDFQRRSAAALGSGRASSEAPPGEISAKSWP